ncbi:formin-like protein 20 isoform X2 [Cimex lectularius]|uniref:CID domain-containing protein n=1 Tax=Cimex lectularius TaxID=79782 RepID=A0A8I6RLL9_CIMLE|nr:formin-like protein 20 isoform X2 [Cimex lectularius]
MTGVEGKKAMESFNEQAFEQKLYQLKDTHDSIASLSSWCLFNQQHYSKIVSTWLSVLKRVRTDHRVLMFYLANDVIQYSKRKQLPYVDAFAPALQKATTMVRDESIRNKILRLFKIWDDRNIYDESFLVDLSGLLTHGNKSNPRVDIEDYQPSILYSRLKSCKNLEKDTEYKLKIMNESSMTISDIEGLQTTLKDRKASEDVVSDIDETMKKVTAYINALEAEVKERKGLLDLLDTGDQYYERDYGEAKIVVNAYKCFTNRVKGVKRKLEIKMEELEEILQRHQKERATADSQEYGVNFPSHGSFMSGSASKDPTLANKLDDFKRDQRLALHKFSEGRLEMKPTSSQLPQTVASSKPVLRNVQPIKTQILDQTTGIDPVMLQNWNSDKDFESPESPPSFEKAGISRPNDDVDMRIKDIDHRNLISLTSRSPTGWSPISAYGDEVLAMSPDDNNVGSIDMDLSDDDDKKPVGKPIEDTSKTSQTHNLHTPEMLPEQNPSFFTSPMLLLPPPPPPSPPSHSVQPPPPPPPLPPVISPSTPVLKGWSQAGTTEYPRNHSDSFPSMSVPPPPPVLLTSPTQRQYQSYESSTSCSPVTASPSLKAGSISPYSPVHVPPPPPPPPPLTPIQYRPLHMNQPNFSQRFSRYSSDYTRPGNITRPTSVTDYNHRSQSISSYNLINCDGRLRPDESPPFNSGHPNQYNHPVPSSYGGVTQNNRQNANLIPTDNLPLYSQAPPFNTLVPGNGITPSPENNRLNLPQTNMNQTSPRYNTGANIRVVNTNQSSFNPRIPHFNSMLRPNINNQQFPIPPRLPHSNQNNKFSGFHKWS